MRLFFVILLLSAVAQIFLPWWVITPLGLAAAFLLGRHGGRAFLAGFTGVGIGWFVLAAWLNIQNHGLLAHRVAQLLPLGGNPWALVVVTSIIGGLVGGLAALAGTWLRQALAPASSVTAEHTTPAGPVPQ